MERLKDKNTPLLRAIGIGNGLAIAWALTGYNPDFVTAEILDTVWKGAVGLAGSAIGLLTCEIVSRKTKFWCLWGHESKEPFSRAFTSEMLEDAAIDEQELRKKVVPWPHDWRDQKRQAMKLLQQHGDSGAVADTHKQFLLRNYSRHLGDNIKVEGRREVPEQPGAVPECVRVFLTS